MFTLGTLANLSYFCILVFNFAHYSQVYIIYWMLKWKMIDILGTQPNFFDWASGEKKKKKKLDCTKDTCNIVLFCTNNVYPQKCQNLIEIFYPGLHWCQMIDMRPIMHRWYNLQRLQTLLYVSLLWPVSHLRITALISYILHCSPPKSSMLP